MGRELGENFNAGGLVVTIWLVESPEVVVLWKTPAELELLYSANPVVIFCFRSPRTRAAKLGHWLS
jgi:hypothetical protein